MDERVIARFFYELKSRDPDCILVGGNTGQAHTVCDYLMRMESTLQRLGDEAGTYFKSLLPEAMGMCDHIVVLTHVPPFFEAAWYDGQYCDNDWLPFFSCKAAGDVLKDAMLRYAHKRMTVLCGHTHGGGTSQISPNLTSFTGPAQYRNPRIQQIFEWE